MKTLLPNVAFGNSSTGHMVGKRLTFASGGGRQMMLGIGSLGGGD